MQTSNEYNFGNETTRRFLLVLLGLQPTHDESESM